MLRTDPPTCPRPPAAGLALAALLGLAGCGIGAGQHVGGGRRRPAPRRPPAPAAPARTGTPELRVSDGGRAGCRTSGTWASCPDGQVLVTERAGPAVAAVGHPAGSHGAPGPGRPRRRVRPRRGRADGHGRAPRLRAEPPVHHLPDPRRGRHRHRRPAGHLAAVRRRGGGQPGAGPAGRRAADQPVRAALRLPADDRRRRHAAGRHRGHRARARSRRTSTRSAARCCGSTWPPAGRRRTTRSSTRTTRRSGWSGTTATATCRAWPCSRAPGGSYSAEHGPTTDDEVNLLQPGANYGWDPAQGGTVGGYDESVPMTDLERFPDAVPAAWSSGSPVEAVSGAGVRVRAAVG